MKTRDHALLGVLVCCAVFVGLLLLLGRFPGCRVQLSTGHRSGPVGDDNVEEPLPDSVKQYEHALVLSNSILDKLIAKDVHSVYAELCDERITTTSTELALSKVATEQFGAIKRYKPMQWNFGTRASEGKELLYSTKIVECEKGEALFVFFFVNDGKYEKLYGLNVRERRGVMGGGQF